MPSCMPWMASADAEYALRRASDGTILLHGLNEVVAARRLKPAVLSQQWADEQLVEPDCCNQQLAGNPPDQAREFHGGASVGVRSRSSRFVSRLTRPSSD